MSSWSWLLLEVPSTRRLSQSSPLAAMSSLLRVRENVKAHCSIHTCADIATPLCTNHRHPSSTGSCCEPPSCPKLGQQFVFPSFPFIHREKVLPAEEQLQVPWLIHSCPGCSFHHAGTVPLFLLTPRARLPMAHWGFSCGSQSSPL